MGNMLAHFGAWFDAWVESAYGTAGFWRVHDPDEHFRTAAASSDVIAELVASILDQQPEIQAVIDVGAGGGQLLGALAALRPDLRLSGIDLRARPDWLPAQIDWAVDLWDVRYARWTSEAAEAVLTEPGPVMIICCEWLDDLPCPVVHQDADGWRQVIVDGAADERNGPRLTDDFLDWADRWWPVGQRAEIGLTRDRAWSALASAITERGGCGLMIDYGHRLEERPTAGSFAGYRDGRAVDPAPAADLNLTAHVAVDAVRAAGEATGLQTVFCCLQSEVISELTSTVAHPDPLVDLARRSQQSALSSRYVWGGHWWLLQRAAAGTVPR
jgi:SAM-dependent MidA family methyltransferase